MSDAEHKIHRAYCPMCDREYAARDDKTAMSIMEKHLAGAHPEYYHELYPKEDDD